jgi:hypothetical protein
MTSVSDQVLHPGTSGSFAADYCELIPRQPPRPRVSSQIGDRTGGATLAGPDAAGAHPQMAGAAASHEPAGSTRITGHEQRSRPDPAPPA